MKTATSISTISAPRQKQHAANLSCCMITYPSTHGVFEETVREICDITHAHGGQVYLDGANMNAMVGLVPPRRHRLRCQPPQPAQDLLHSAWRRRSGHGADRRQGASASAFLPGHPATDGRPGAVSAAPYGSASILPISWTYCLMMGGEGLTQATKVAILNANYIAARLKGAYDVLYKSSQGPRGA